MKKLTVIAGLFLLLSACSTSEDATVVMPQLFTYDTAIYRLANQAFTITNYDDLESGGKQYKHAIVDVSGYKSANDQASVSFDLYYEKGKSISGSYVIYNQETNPVDFENYLDQNHHACKGSESLGKLLHNGNQTSLSRNPVGTLTIIAHSPVDYTVQFANKFRVYDSFWNVTSEVPVNINLRAAANIRNF